MGIHSKGISMVIHSHGNSYSHAHLYSPHFVEFSDGQAGEVFYVDDKHNI